MADQQTTNDNPQTTGTYQPPTPYASYPTPQGAPQQGTVPITNLYPQYPPQHYAPPPQHTGQPQPQQHYAPYPYPCPQQQQYMPPYPQQPPPPQTSAQSPPQPDSVAAFFNKLTHSIFVTKQKVLEITGQTQGTVDPELQGKIEKLKSIHDQYERLETLAKQLLSNFKGFSESVKLFGDHFYETGVKEVGPLAEPLRESGELHRALDKQSENFMSSVKKLLDVISTFKGAAVEDTMVNLQRYTLARQEFDGAQLRLADAKVGTSPSPDKIAECEVLVQESKRLMEQLGNDLHTKVIMLNEKRVQDLSVRLSEYVASLKNYYLACNRIMDEHPITIKDDSTAEFKALMGDQ